MIEQILSRKNLLQAMYKVQKNYGSAGVDHMPVTKLSELLLIDKEVLTDKVRSGKYLPQPILAWPVCVQRTGRKSADDNLFLYNKCYVYVIECEDNSLYIGQTLDLIKRWEQHISEQGANWTKSHKCIQTYQKIQTDKNCAL